MRSAFTKLTIVLLCLVFLSACGGTATSTPETVRIRPQPPPEYLDKKNPKSGNLEAASNGQLIFRIHCVMCHGEKGEGNGPAATSLKPKPASFATNQDEYSDAYLYWRISEGGLMTPFSSAMPSWRAILSEDEIWQVVTFIRTLQPPDTSD